MDALFLQLLGVEFGVGRRRRMDGEGFHVRHIGEEGEQFQIVNKCHGCLLVAFDLKCEDGAAAFWKISGIEPFLFRVICGKRMVDALDHRLCLQVVDDLLRILHMTLHPKGKRLQSL